MVNRFYEAITVKPSQVIYCNYSQNWDIALANIKANIKYIYPVGTPGFLSFERAQWVLTADNIVVTQLSLTRPNSPENITLAGILGKYNEVFSLHMEGTGLYGLRISMDGVLYPNNSGYRIIGVFTAAIQDARHIERVDINLSNLSTISNLPPNNWANPIIENVRQKKILEQAISEEKILLSQPIEWISGVPVPSNFDTTLKVKIDGIDFPPMKGQLLLHRVEGLTDPKIGLILTTEGPLVPGWSTWITSPDISLGSDPTSIVSESFIQQPSKFAPLVSRSKAIQEFNENKECGVEVTAENGHIHVKITPTPFFRQISWYGLGRDYSENPSMVLVDEGTIYIQVTSECFTGIINAQGTILGGKKFLSTFCAELSGNLQARNFIKNITNYIGPLPFDGLWRDTLLGELKLSQKSERTNGTFSEGGIIEGTVTGKVANISWEKTTGDNGVGFFSAVNSGLLVGMIWRKGKDVIPEIIVAIQVMLSATRSDSKTGNILLPENDAEAEQLKYLGYDLSSASKHQEAARILFTVVTYFMDKAEATTNDLSVHKSYLINQAVPLYTLINNAFEAGDYPILIKSISMAIDLQRRLGKGSADRLSFLEHTEKYICELNKHAEAMDKLAALFDRGLKYVSSSGIGIRLEEIPTKLGIIISEVYLYTPASRAEIMAGDILVEIDGISVLEMNHEQASNLLLGSAGTSVLIKVIRNKQQLKLNLVREPLINLKSEQRDKLIRAMSSIYDIADHTSQDYRAGAYELNELLKNPHLLTDFEDLIIHIEELQRSIKNRRLAVIEFSEICLSGSHIALSLFQRFISLQELSIKEGKPAYYNSVQIQKLDQDIDEFEVHPEVAEIYKDLLKMFILIICEFDKMGIETRGKLSIVKGAAEFSSKLSSPIQIADSMSKFAGWLDKWRSRMVTDAAKIDSLQFGQEFYESYVQILLDLNLPEQALQASECARARAFADLLASGQKKQTYFGQSIYSEGILFNTASAPSLSIQDIKDIAISQGGTIIEYFLLKDYIAIWAISPKGKIEVIRVPVDINQLNAIIERLVVLMGPNGLSSKDGRELRPEATALLRSLDETLIAPLEMKNLLPTNPKTVVTVVPHKNLFRVPFAALLDEKNQYFVEKHPLIYETALSVLEYIQKNSKGNTLNRKSRHLLALVSPEPLPSSERSPQKTFLSLQDTAELFRKYIAGFYAAEEIRNIYFGQNATESILRKKAPYADVLYFATHSEVNGKEPLKSFIALAKNNSFSGHFRVADVYDLNLQVELTILAACETGGGSVSGDGVDGLNRAFTQAGSLALLMSLWEIAEEITNLIMVGFHQFWIQRNTGKAVSLRDAQLELLKTYRTQPNLWAGFVLFGNPN